MLEPLNEFICDTCHQLIEDNSEGWFEWLQYYDHEKSRMVNEKFRICHHNKRCTKFFSNPKASSMYLTDLMKVAPYQLISFLDGNISPKDEYKGPEINDMEEYVELAKRLTVPYYEEARLYWGSFLSSGNYNEYDAVTVYFPDNLKRIIEEFGDE